MAACAVLFAIAIYALPKNADDKTPMPISRTSALWVQVQSQDDTVVITKNYSGLAVEDALLQSIKSQLPENTIVLVKFENQQVTLYFETDKGVYRSAAGERITDDDLLKETT